MTERMSATDVAFFYLEGPTTPQHVGGLALFEPPAEGFDYDQLVRLLEERISLVPRYRQKVRQVPGHLANPVWVDDPAFDITYHVRRSVMPRPGSVEQLLEFCARIQARLLDRSRPLWEMYLVAGLADGRVAIITKTHHSMVDGLGAIDIAQVILDASPQPRRTVEAIWMPEPEPTAKELVVDALLGVAGRPAAVLDAVRLGLNDVRWTAGRLGGAVAGLMSIGVAAARSTSTSTSPLSVGPGEQRRIALARTRLADYRAVREANGGTVNDVVLATVAGAVREWLLFRGQPVGPSATVRTLVPVSVEDDSGGRVTGLVLELPVGEPDPLLRLARISYAMATHKGSGSGEWTSADALVALGGFAPPTLHALGARAANGLTRRLFQLVVTNVPGPQVALYAAGAKLAEMFPILPLGQGQAVSIGLTSYDGGVYFGVNGDREAMADVGVLARLLEESLAELVEASSAPLTQRSRAARTVRRPRGWRAGSGRGSAASLTREPRS